MSLPLEEKFRLEEDTFITINDLLQPIDFVKKGKKEAISNVPAVFDIEASSFIYEGNKAGCMYAWVFGINGKCVRGRTWEDFMSLIDKVCKYYHLSAEKRLVVYVHNLSYEFQWIKERFKWLKVFALDTREPVYAITTRGIEFRCSYVLSGMSLAKVGENLTKYKVNKLVGDLDYYKLRTPETPLTDTEWGYILNDGLVVMAYIQELKEREGSIRDLPITKTGFVRNLFRSRTLAGENKFTYGKLMRSLRLSLEDYEQLKDTYIGGFTHANHKYVGKTCKDVSSFDFTSSYPAVMIGEKYPMSTPKHVIVKDEKELEKYLDLYACMFRLTLWDVEPIFDYEHYISRSHCHICEDYVVDNGRIVRASKLSISVTEQDYKIIAKTYKWSKMAISNFKIMYRDYLPVDYVKTVLELYKNKTTLKGVEGKEVEYQVSKENVNSSYGMTVTDPCRCEILYDKEQGWTREIPDYEEVLDKYNKSTQRFLYYAWGVWITAYARANLWSGILEFGNDYIYSDTDSLKVFNREKHQKYIDNYNKEVTSKINRCLEEYKIDKKMACPKTIKGENKPLGVWDYEGTYSKFKTLGAKRYMYVEDDKLHITIAGVSKKAGAEYLMWKYKTIDKIFKNFNEGLVFPSSYGEEGKNASGKLCHTYIDGYVSGYVEDYLGHTARFEEFSLVYLEPTEYSLSLDEAFKQYLLGRSDIFCK